MMERVDSVMRRGASVFGIAVLAGTLVLTGCQAEQRPGGTVSVSGTGNSATHAAGSASVSGTGTAAHEEASPGASTAGSPAQQLDAAVPEVDKAIAAAEAGDLETARHEYDEFHEKWETFEDDLKAQSQEAYTAIEDKIHAVEAELVTAAEPVKESVVSALQELRQVIDEQKSKLSS